MRDARLGVPQSSFPTPRRGRWSEANENLVYGVVHAAAQTRPCSRLLTNIPASKRQSECDVGRAETASRDSPGVVLAFPAWEARWCLESHRGKSISPRDCNARSCTTCAMCDKALELLRALLSRVIKLPLVPSLRWPYARDKTIIKQTTG